MPKPMHFEYKEFPDLNLTIVALDSKLSDYDFMPVIENGKAITDAFGRPMVTQTAKTIKDCRGIDGCIYLCLGHVSDAKMVDLIEKFQKLKKEKGWKPNLSPIVPDPKFNFN